MPANAPLFLFLAAAVGGTFAFVSIVVWVTGRTQERRDRDRFALLKTLVEHPGESADRVLAMLKDQEERRAERKDREERRGFVVGGLVTLACGVGLAVMLEALPAKSGAWTVGLIPGLIGIALLGVGVLMKPRRRPEGE